LEEAHLAEFAKFIHYFDPPRTRHGVVLHLYTDPDMADAVAYAELSGRDGKKDLLYSVQVLPGDDSVTIVGEIELSRDAENTGYPETVSLYKTSATATDAPEIAAVIRRLATDVCSQRQWLKKLEPES